MTDQSLHPVRSCAALVAAGALAGALIVPAPALAAQDGAKDEVVYVKGSAAGATEGVYVVNAFETEGAERVSDPGAYREVTNLSTDEALEQRDGAVELTTTAGAPFYYQGTMEADVALPWDITLTYRLNGQEVDPAELAGADGVLEVSFDVRANADADVSDFADSYVLQAQGTFPSEAFAVIDSGDATMARSGSNVVMTCLVLPGESKTFEFSGLVNDFHYDGWQVAGMALSMAVDLSDQDTAQLASATEALEDATGQLSDGAQELADGLAVLNEGADATAQGAGALNEGADELAQGASQLAGGVDSAVAGLDRLSVAGESVAAGWRQVYEGVGGVAHAVAQLQAGSEQYEQGLANGAAQYAEGASQAGQAQAAYEQAAAQAAAALKVVQSDAATEDERAAAAEQLSAALSAMNRYEKNAANTAKAAGAYGALMSAQDSYAELGEGIAALAGSEGVAALESGANEFDAGLAQYLSGAQDAAEQSGALAAGAEGVSQGAQGLAEGAASVADATDAIASGTSAVVEGAGTLAGGASQLADSVQGLDQQILDELQAAIDEKLGADFEPHSYAVSSNTQVDSVQFVYVIEGISEPEEEAPAEEEQPERTIFDRFFALFNSEG